MDRILGIKIRFLQTHAIYHIGRTPAHWARRTIMACHPIAMFALKAAKAFSCTLHQPLTGDRRAICHCFADISLRTSTLKGPLLPLEF
ncbi:hypothetical protein ES702_02650 [subsurface metagenome]